MRREIIELIVGNNETEIRGEYPYEAVDEATSFYRKGYFHTPSYKSGRWDGREHLLKRRRFPSGLLTVVLSVLEDLGEMYVLTDRRNELSDLQPFGIDGIKLRDYQVNAIGQMLKRLRGVVRIPTGGGKTLIAGATIKALNVPTAYIVHTSTLFSQTEEVFRELFDPDDIGMVGGGKYNFGKYTICMVQTLRKLIQKKEVDELLRFEALFIDECHHVHSDGSKASWYVAQQYFKNAHIRFGLSATPTLEKHGLLLQAATGPLIHSIELPELQEKGYISKVDITFHRVEVEEGEEDVPELSKAEEAVANLSLEEDPTKYLREFKDDYETHIIRGRKRNVLIADLAVKSAGNGDLCLVFVERRFHGTLLNSIIHFFTDGNTDIKCVFLCGENSKKEIKFYKNEAREKRLDILIVTRQLFGEGIDIPAVNVLMNAAGGKEMVAFTQMFGRGLRVTNDKNTVRYIDFYDSGNSYLEKHSRARMRHLKNLGQGHVNLV